MSDTIIYKRVDSNDADFQNLIGLLDQDLSERYGEFQTFFTQFNYLDASFKVIVAYVDGQAVGCGSIKYYDDKAHELKRMFVKNNQRSQGIGYNIIVELEKWAEELNVENIILETGINQPEAIHLYRKCGYSIIPNFDQYIGVEESVCMQKFLTTR